MLSKWILFKFRRVTFIFVKPFFKWLGLGIGANGCYHMGKIEGINTSYEAANEIINVSKLYYFWYNVFYLPVWQNVKIIINNMSYIFQISISAASLLFTIILLLIILIGLYFTYKFVRYVTMKLLLKKEHNNDLGQYMLELIKKLNYYDGNKIDKVVKSIKTIEKKEDIKVNSDELSLLSDNLKGDAPIDIIAQLKKENKELKRQNTILKKYK